MLEKWLSKEAIEVNVKVSNWKEAVQKGGELLVENGKATQDYISSMIHVVKDIGPYIVVAPGIAIPHARPEDGAKAVGLSLVTLEKPVNFGNPDNDPVSVVVCLCSTDSESHLKALSSLVEFLSLDSNIVAIKKAASKEEVISLIKKY